MNKDNYWVRYSEKIPWKTFEDMYSDIIEHKSFNQFSIRLIIGALLIQDKENFNDEETVENIKKSPELKYFLGVSNSIELVIFDAKSLRHYRKKIGKNRINEIYNIINNENLKSSNTDSLDNIEEGKATRYWIITCCLLAHTMFFVTFCIYKITPLIWVNTLSIATYVVCLFLNKINKSQITIILICIELLVHAIVAVIFLGWNSGFQYYMLGIGPMMFLNLNFKIKYRIFLLIFDIIAFFSLHQFINVINLKTFYYDKLQFSDINIILLLLLMAVIIYRYNEEVQQSNNNLKILNSKLRTISEFDQLTGLFNRRHTMEIINYYKNLYEKEEFPFVIAIADIDKFKSVNDTYGHECGDIVLVEIATIMRKNLEQGEFVARWGGEEFLFIFPFLHLDEAYNKMEKVRKAVMENPIKYGEVTLNITITAGLDEYKVNEDTREILKNADARLYLGKINGRNRIVISEN